MGCRLKLAKATPTTFTTLNRSAILGTASNLTVRLSDRQFFDRVPKRALILAAGGEHCCCDSNQGYGELNQDEHWNYLMQDTHFNLSF